MNPKVKKLWIKALRSGKYNQAAGHLRYEQEGVVYHCCLGVLTELYCKETGADFESLIQEDTNGDPIEFTPPLVCEWADLAHPNPMLDGRTAATLNDNDVPFKEIAALIERNL